MPTATKKMKKETGMLMQLFELEVGAFIKKSKCPLCGMKNLIHRSWRKDFICGECREVFGLENGKVYHLGHQDQID